MGWATVLWLSLVCSLALFGGLFTLAPVDKTEALQIGIAETMLRLQEWVVPQWNGHLYADKPPLPYWLAMVVWQWFGLTPELARLPAAICATLGVAVIAWLLQRVARRELPAREAWLRAALAGTLLALSPGWIVFAHSAVHDIYLSVAITLALAGYAIGFCMPESPFRPRRWAAWIGFWCGVGFLSKGLLGIGLPLLIIGADCCLRGETRRVILRPLPLLQMGTAMLVVISPWLAGLIAGRRWDYLQGFIGFSNLQRATQAVDGHHQHPLFYLPVLLALLWRGGRCCCPRCSSSGSGAGPGGRLQAWIDCSSWRQCGCCSGLCCSARSPPNWPGTCCPSCRPPYC
ncbi:glycosyltransferase family 39 protein [Synechococcus sp. GFB01]|uniref:ArnT family glycosyltransferase n=2 Tax=Synechococcus sp. GFB01 TaxID=1662190 RepID=UPI000A6B6A0F|nr:glycosyltransferase family 39 protein [Synechococcus sp. GFB01]